jgi:hypothetical protein
MKFTVNNKKLKIVKQSPLLNILPIELVEIIEEMVYGVQHREKFTPMMNELMLKAAIKRMTYLNTGEYYLGCPPYVSFVQLINEKIDDKDYLVQVLNTCKCCKKHQINRPKNINDNHLIQFSISYHYSKCDCQCRHYARMICCSV